MISLQTLSAAGVFEVLDTFSRRPAEFTPEPEGPEIELR